MLFAPEEWRVAWLIAKRQPPPETVPTLAEMTRIVAGLDGVHPGLKALWEGML